MRRFKSSFIFLTILIVVILYAYFYEHKKRNETEKIKASSEQVVPVDKSTINSVNINDEIIFSKNNKGTWFLESPIEWELKEDHINDLLEQLSSKAELVKDDLSDLDIAQFGILASNLIKIKTLNNETFSLSIGDKSPVSTEKYFLFKGKTNKILLVNEQVAKSLNKDVSEIRDTKIFDKNVLISKIKFLNFQLNVSDNVWSLEGKDYLIDDLKVSKFVEDILNLDIKNFPINRRLSTKDLKNLWNDYKLKYTNVEIFFNEGSYKFYTSKKADKFYLAFYKGSSQSEIYEISEEIFNKFKLTVDEFRKKNIFSFKAEAVNSIEFFNENNFSIIKRTNKTDWVLDGIILDKVKINSFFDKLNSLEVQTFIDSSTLSKYGLNKPTQKIILKDKDELSILDLVFGTVNNDKVFTLYNSKIYEVNAGILDRIDAQSYIEDIK